MVEMVEIHQEVWFVMLESAKDQVIGVDTPGQQVPPCVLYGMACLLIWDAVARGPWYSGYPRKPKHCYGTATTLAKPSIRPMVNLYNGM
jgi:hypothetical protein